jgi:hypothetical protein
MSWLILVAALVGAYFFGLAVYRLFLSGKRFADVIGKTRELLVQLDSYELVDPKEASAMGKADLDRVLAARRALILRRIRRREDRQRRLVNRIREIDVDKRWS